MITNDQIEDVFTYHPPNAHQAECYGYIREAAKNLASVILNNTPKCADQQASLRLLREAVMTANAAVALKGLV